MREVNFYLTSSGKSPITNFLDSLSGKQVQKITWVLEIIEEYGIVPKQHFKKLVNTDDIWEVRINVIKLTDVGIKYGLKPNKLRAVPKFPDINVGAIQ